MFPPATILGGEREKELRMRLAMVVEKERLATLQERGVLLPDPSRIAEESLRPAYGWLAARMLERLPPPPGATWPLWAWAWYDGFDVSQPHERNDEFVVLEIRKPPEEVLLSEFHSWHHVLNNWYLPDERAADKGEAEYDAFYAEIDALGLPGWQARHPEEMQTRIEESWLRTLDVRRSDDVVQAAFFSLSSDEVVAVRPWDRSGARRRRVEACIPDGIGNDRAASLSYCAA
jgi:hypothetical protein